MKTCSKCKESKELSEFNNAAATKDGKNSQCKACVSLRRKQAHLSSPQKERQRAIANRNKGKLSHYIVYYLPKENYCGMTMDPTPRMRVHKRDGNDTTGWITITTAKTKKEARSIENHYHALGMEGAYAYKTKTN